MGETLVINVVVGLLAGFLGGVLLLMAVGIWNGLGGQTPLVDEPNGVPEAEPETNVQMRERLAALEALTVQDDRKVAELWSLRREACELAGALDDLAANGVVLEEALWRLVQKHRPPTAGEVDLSCVDEREP